jgi:hypothetical protein
MLPSDLILHRDVALASIHDREDGHLTFDHRCRLWLALGPFGSTTGSEQRTAGWVRRTRLAVSCIEKTVPLWEATYQYDTHLHHTLHSINAFVRGDGTSDETAAAMKDQWVYTDNLGELGHAPALYVGYGASAAAYVALWDERTEFPADAFADGELYDPYDWDAAFYAAAAVAGGIPGSSASDASRRWQFWDWYLNTALSSAYCAAKTS